MRLVIGMIHFLSSSIASGLFRNGIIDEEKVPVCQYGFELIISTAIGFFLVMLSGIIFEQALSALIFYSLFVIVRLFTGGYHTASHLRCKTVLVCCCISVLAMSELLNQYSGVLLNTVLLIPYMTAVIMFAPVEHINIPMTEEKRIRNRRISVITAITLTSANLVCCIFIPGISVVISLTLLVIAVLIIISKIQERRKSDYEKDC